MPKPARRKKAAPSAEERRVSEAAPSTFLPDYSVAIVEAVREPLVLLDSGLRVLVANAAGQPPAPEAVRLLNAAADTCAMPEPMRPIAKPRRSGFS